jgi:uncharacterized protein
MSMFFVIFFSLYAALHAYVFIKTWNAFKFGLATGSILAFIFLLCLFMPLLVRSFEHGGHESVARVFAYGGYIWMCLIFIFFVISLSIDFSRLCIIIFSSIAKINLPHTIHSGLVFFLVSAVASIAITAYGYHEAQTIHTERIGIETSKLPPGVDKLTIVQISDVHLGLINKDVRLRRAVDIIKQIKPDILVSTGDLVDGQINSLNGLSDILKEIEAPYGKYAIMGNHEFYAGVGVSEDFTSKAGFVMLRQEGVTIQNIVNIVGVDDKGHGRQRVFTPARKVLERVPQNIFTIFLKHRPEVDADLLGLFDLQLSGHTHGGQVYPFRYITQLSFPMVAGLYPLDDDTVLYVSRGTGTWGPPIRFMTPPEVTVFEIIRK